MERLIGIGEAAQTLGVSITTLRRWEATGKLSAIHTAGGHRRYDLAKLKPELFHAQSQTERSTIAYARVSSHDQKDDLERQKQVLELYCARQGWTFELVSDLGSGMNDQKKGLRRLLNAIIDGKVGRLVITHKDPRNPSHRSMHCVNNSMPSSANSFRGCWKSPRMHRKWPSSSWGRHFRTSLPSVRIIRNSVKKSPRPIQLD